jgi:hypothetical protein
MAYWDLGPTEEEQEMAGLPRKSVTSTVAAVIALFTSLATCGAEVPVVPLAHFDEDYQKTVPSGGGGILVGATVGDDEAGYLLKPALFIPAGMYTKVPVLCVETVSVDGSYWSHGELAGPTVAEDQGALRFLPNSPKTKDPQGTQWPSEIREFGPNNIAVLAGLGACSSQENRNTRTFFAVDRSKGPDRNSANAHYHLAVNPRVADEVQVNYTRLDGAKARVLCGGAEKKFHNTAYSMVCDLEGPFADETSVELDPSLHGHPLSSYRFDLIYAHAR